MGIARTLVENCETAALQMKKDQLYIRVEQNNTAAVTMYERLNYKAQVHEYFGVKDTTILLNKKLGLPAFDDRNRTQDESESIVLDFVL